MTEVAHTPRTDMLAYVTVRKRRRPPKVSLPSRI